MQPLLNQGHPPYRLISAPQYLLYFCYTCLPPPNLSPWFPEHLHTLLFSLQGPSLMRLHHVWADGKDRADHYREHWLQCRTWETLSDVNGADKSFHSARKPERAQRVPTRLSPAWSPSVSTHKRGSRPRGRAPGIKLSSAVGAAHIHMDIKGSDAGLCVGNSDAQGIT